ncbi:MAG TPA: T9SS type A sorting domain-containing protein [Candidatus Kapabacteria bacterium]|nr:T9SS type A sorting domain-containing protein [Candidatus Kapabacteria bacterium]
MKQRFILLALVLGLALSIVPSAFAQWVDTKGPTDANARCIVANGDNVFLGTHGEGIYYSSDKGISWKNIASNWFVKALAYSGTTIYAGLENGGLLYSTDNGKTWQQVDFSGLNYNYNYVNALATSGKTVFAATVGGLIYSIDLGKTWEQIDTGLNSIGSITQAYALTIRSTNLYVGGFSSNTATIPLVINGATWNIINVGISRINNAIAVGDSAIFVAAALGSVSSPSMLFRSTDNRASWDTVYSMDSYTGMITGVTLNSGSVFMSTDHDSIFRSTDNGNTWTPICTGLTASPITTIVSEGGVLYAGSDDRAGIFRSIDNGDHWIATGGNGLSWSQVGKFASTTTHLFALADGVYSTTNNGDNWYPLPLTPLVNTATWITSLAAGGTNLFLGVERPPDPGGAQTTSGLFLSTDYGSNWQKLRSPSKDTEITGLAVIGSNLLANDGNDSTYVSTDTGKTWAHQTFPLNLSSFASRGSEVFATDFGDGISYSTDQGVTWKGFVTLSIGWSINCIAATDTCVFAGTNIGLYRMGNHSNVRFFPGGREVINTLLAIGNTLFAGTDGGIYMTTNDGASWTRIDQYYSQFGSSNLLYTFNGYLFGYFNACTVGRRSLSDFGVNEVRPTTLMTDRFRCFPNPTSSISTISFSNSQREFVNLNIVDILGKECAELFSGELEGGEHSYQWDASRFPPGMYVCLIRSNGLTKRLPVMVLR